MDKRFSIVNFSEKSFLAIFQKKSGTFQKFSRTRPEIVNFGGKIRKFLRKFPTNFFLQ